MAGKEKDPVLVMRGKRAWLTYRLRRLYQEVREAPSQEAAQRVIEETFNPQRRRRS